MLNLLLVSFVEQYGLIIVLAVVLGFLMLVSFNRRRREADSRAELNNLIKVGARVKTYGGLYGKVVEIEDTTDGKIVLLETGVGNKKSFQQIHINAIFGLDDKQPVVLDAEGNSVFPDLDALEKERMAEAEKVEETKPEAKKEETPAPKKAPAKKPATKKAQTHKK